MRDVNALMQRRKDSPNGTGHYHIAEPYPYRVRVSLQERTVADTTRAIILKEVGKSLYNPTFYIPREDVDLKAFEREAGYTTHCPIKGEASYWTFSDAADPVERAAWSYDDPLEYSAAIAGHLGFDQRYATLEIRPI